MCPLFTLQFCSLLHFWRSIAFGPAFFFPTHWCRVFQSRVFRPVTTKFAKECQPVEIRLQQICQSTSRLLLLSQPAVDTSSYQNSRFKTHQGNRQMCEFQLEMHQKRLAAGIHCGASSSDPTAAAMTQPLNCDRGAVCIGKGKVRKGIGKGENRGKR